MTSIIKIEHLKKKFYDNEVLEDINLEINKGEVVCIIGSSGSGKSTLLRCLNQLEMPTSGNIYYKGENLLDKNCNINCKLVLLIKLDIQAYYNMMVILGLEC